MNVITAVYLCVPPFMERVYVKSQLNYSKILKYDSGRCCQEFSQRTILYEKRNCVQLN